MNQTQPRGIHPVTAGVIGAATVAAGAAAVMLSKKENRKKLHDAVRTIKKKGDGLAKKAAKHTETLRSHIPRLADDIKHLHDSAGRLKKTMSKE